ncbi:MAG: aminotransferase class V-fold PLP-dependent enzyme [Sphaerochaetaceae bacterium]
MKRIYLDNASTSFPKAPGTAEAMFDYLTENGANLNRGEYSDTFSAEEHVNHVRSLLASHFGSSHPECVAFSQSVTYAINAIISGLFNRETPVLISSMEHNAVVRPLALHRIPFIQIPSDRQGHCLLSKLPSLAAHQAKALIIQSASNVSGTIQDIALASKLAHENGLLMIVDAAQGSPHVKLDMEKMGIDAVCFTGHKGFLGPQGIGGMVLSPELAALLPPFAAGGTGSLSYAAAMPDFLPDKFEAGTQNIPGLFGLEASLEYEKAYHEKIEAHLKWLTEMLINGLSEIDGVTVLGPPSSELRTPVVSITTQGADIAQLCTMLEQRAGIEARVGLHCAPLAHRSLGSFPEGALRFSPGPFTTDEEAETAISVLRSCLK